LITLMYSNFVPSAEHCARLEALAGRGNVAVADSEAAAQASAATTQIAFGHRYLRQLLPGAANLRWVQTTYSWYNYCDPIPYYPRAARWGWTWGL